MGVVIVHQRYRHERQGTPLPIELCVAVRAISNAAKVELSVALVVKSEVGGMRFVRDPRIRMVAGAFAIASWEYNASAWHRVMGGPARLPSSSFALKMVRDTVHGRSPFSEATPVNPVFNVPSSFRNSTRPR